MKDIIGRQVELALIHHGAGRLSEAESLYKSALAVDPECFDALHMLGVVHQQRGESTRAVELIERAIAVMPGSSSALANLGIAYQSLNRMDMAEASIRKAIVLQPEWDGGHNNLGSILGAAGRLDEAQACFRKAVGLQPSNLDALNNLGSVCRDLGQLDEARDCFRQALALRPQDPGILSALGSILARQGELAEAEKHYRLVLQLDENRFDATCNLGDVLRRQDRLDEAELLCRRAVALRPDDPDALNTLASVLHRTSALEEAEACCRKALSIRAEDVNTMNTLGSVCIARDRPEQAEACFRSVLKLRPDSATARYNLSMLRLMEGDYEEGFELYESRFDVLQQDFGVAREIQDLIKDTRRWRGEPLFGRRLLIWAEQGFGDSLMMLRYLPMVLARAGGQVMVKCERALERVVYSIAGLDGEVSCVQSIAPTDFDRHCPIMSLPLLFATTMHEIPDRVPYIEVADALRDDWKQRLSSIHGTKVGLAWAGSLRLRENARRSLPLAAFESLFGTPDVRFFSLQKGDGAEQANAFSGQIEDWMADCDDFLDTAALIDNLDLVISVDSAVAHLAGALGKPAWLLNRLGSEWRWGPTSERSPWYRSMRIFRQREVGKWDTVIAQLSDELTRFKRSEQEQRQR